MARATGKVSELLDQLRAEFDQLASNSNEAALAKIQRDELERKLEAQLGEIGMMQQHLTELERKHISVKQSYEEEISRLKQGNGSNGSGVSDSKRARTDGINVGLNVTFPPLTGLPSCPSSAALVPGKGSGMESANALPPPGPPSLPGVQTGGVGGKAGVPLPSIQIPPLTQQPPPQLSTAAAAATTTPKYEKEALPSVTGTTTQSAVTIEMSHAFEHQSVVCCVRFTTDGKFLATGCNKAAVLYNVASGEPLCLFTSEGAFEPSQFQQTDGDSYVRSVCFSPDGKYLVAGSEDKAIKVWDIATRRLKSNLLGHDLDIYSVDCSNNGQFVASGSGDKMVKLWDLQSASCQRTFRVEDSGPTEGVTSVSISSDNNSIVAGSLDRVVRIWDVTTGQLTDKFEGHSDSVYSVSFSPDCKSVVSGALDKTLKIWDTRSSSRNGLRNTFVGHKDFVLSVVFAPSGDLVLSGSKDRSIQFWDLRQTNSPVHVLSGHQNSVISVSHAPNMQVFATGSGDKKAKIWKYEGCP